MWPTAQQLEKCCAEKKSLSKKFKDFFCRMNIRETSRPRLQCQGFSGTWVSDGRAVITHGTNHANLTISFIGWEILQYEAFSCNPCIVE